MSEDPGAVLITGCSSGIGHETARHLAAKGWTVYATARRPETLGELAESGCETLALDVTDEASMKAAVNAVEGAGGLPGSSSPTAATPFLNSFIDFPSEAASSGSLLAPKRTRTITRPTTRS